MDIEILNIMNGDLYRVMMMLIEGLTLMVALASLMFVLVAIVCAVCDLLGETGDYPRSKIRARSRRLVQQVVIDSMTKGWALDR